MLRLPHVASFFLIACGEDVSDVDAAAEVEVAVDGEAPLDSASDLAPDSAPDVAPDVVDTTPDTTAATLTPDVWHARSLSACEGLGPGGEDCHSRLLWRPAACGGAACATLIIYWAGGEGGCVDGSYDGLLEKWADSGLVVACAQPFTTSDESGRYPYADELERIDLLTRRVRQDAAIAWDGSHLVIAGVSHGATAPVAAIAESRAFATRPDVFTGRDGTALILFDGISDPARLEAWAGLQDDPACGLWHARFVGRYGGGGPLTHACDNGACFCAGGGTGWERDSTVIGQPATGDWPASPYMCADFASPAQTIHWRIVSCGGGQAEPCSLLGDIVPDDQQQRLADALTTCPELAVTYADHPGCAHTVCGGWDFCGGERARAWLTSLGW